MQVRLTVLLVPQPFNPGYEWFNTSQNVVIPNPLKSSFNEYTGGVFQQATSIVTETGK